MKYEFQILSGSYFDGKVNHGKGSKVKSDKRLDESFPGKFKLITKAASEAKAEEEAGEMISNILPEGEVEELSLDSMEDASDKFNYSQEDTGLLVGQKGTAYYVFDIDDQDTPLNESGLKKNQVRKFIKENCEEE